MTETWQDGFRAALLRHVQRSGYPQATKIADWSEDTGGGCDTCGPDIEVDIWFECAEHDLCKRHTHRYSYWGSFGYLMESLLGEE